MRFLTIAFALASVFGQAQTSALPTNARAPLRTAPFRIDWDVRIPMRDGVKLCSTVFRPANQREPLPVILAMTPYTLSFTAEWGRFFAQNGYVFVSVDMRGRGDSEGSHTPMVRDPQDGYDTVEWLARQPWCNGKVGMTGLSYLGGTQWATAKLRPPHLATIVPVAAVHPGVDVPTLGGIHFVDTMDIVLRTSGRSRKGGGLGGDEYWDGMAHDFFRSGRPWRELDRFFGLPSPVFQAWMRHPAHDAYWKAATPTTEDYRKLDIPILTITGHYDDDQMGAMTYYRDHMRHGSPAAKDRHFLVIGPWDHMQTRTPALECEGVAFGKASLVDMNALHKAWFDWTLKGGPKPDFLKDRVACYIQGEDVWRYADRLEGISQGVRKYFLHGPSAGARAGSLLENQPPAGGPQRLTHDPLDPVPLTWDQKPPTGGLLVQPDATLIAVKRQFHHEALSYLTEPFAADSTLCGSSSFSVWVRMTVPDEDFFVSLHEVKADGTTQQLGWDCLRARYRSSFEREDLVNPGEPTRLDFNRFPIIGKQFAKGSRLKLVFGALNLPWAQRNYHSGGTVADETPKVARVAHLEVLNDSTHPAILKAPFGEPTPMANTRDALRTRANQLHHSLLTVDTHCDTPLLLRGGFDLGRRHAPGRITEGQQDFVRMKEGGLAASFFAVFTSQGPLDEAGRAKAYAEARKGLESVEAALRKHPELAENALSPQDARRIHASGKRAIFLALENGYPIGRDIAKVNTFHDLGVRYITLAHNKDNDLCASATDRGEEGKRPDTGLSEFGREVVRRMNALGILVDISHISPRSVSDVLQVSKAPVLASHSACRTLCDNPRNLSDDQLRAIRDRGGVVQIGIIADFLKPMPSYPERYAALDAFWNKLDTFFDGPERNPERADALEREWTALQQRFPSPTVTVKDLVDHIDHAVKVIGIDHVGIGTDFDGGGGLTDCNDVTEFPRITEELLRRGYTESDIRKIWGGNAMRVMETAQRVVN